MFPINLSRYKNQSVLWLLLIVLCGGFLRFFGADWGLPYHLHPDEWTVVDSAIKMLAKGDFKPGVFMRPDHFEIYGNAILFSAYSNWLYDVPAHKLFEYDTSPFYFLARCFTAFWGTAMIVVAYKIGEEVRKRSGVFIAFFVAFMPPFIHMSHFATPDVPLTFMLMMVTWGAVCYLKKPDYKNVIVMGAFTALAVTIKYPGAIASLLIFLVILLKTGKNNLPVFFLHGAIALVTISLVILIFAPTLYTDYDRVIAAFTKEARSEHLGADGLGYWGNVSYYIRRFAGYSGLLFIGVFCVGVLSVMKRRELYTFPLFFGVIYMFVLSYIPLHWNRWALPMYIAPLFIAGVGLRATVDYLQAKKNRFLSIAVITVIVVVAMNFMVSSFVVCGNFGIEDSRVASRKYCIQNQITQTKTIFEGYTPFEAKKPSRLFDHFKISDGKLRAGDRSKQYVIISSFMYDRFKGEPKRFEKENKIYNLLEEQFVTVKEFKNNNVAYSLFSLVNISNKMRYLFNISSSYSGPTIKIYKKK